MCVFLQVRYPFNHQTLYPRPSPCRKQLFGPAGKANSTFETGLSHQTSRLHQKVHFQKSDSPCQHPIYGELAKVDRQGRCQKLLWEKSENRQSVQSWGLWLGRIRETHPEPCAVERIWHIRGSLERIWRIKDSLERIWRIQDSPGQILALPFS